MRDHRRVVFGSLAAALLLVASGCPVYYTQPQPQPQPPVVTGPPASLVITNLSAEPVYYIHMSPSASSSWGQDLLGQDVLGVGSSFTITGVTSGQWDVAVFDQTGNCKIFYQEWFDPGTEYTLDVDAYEWTPPYECPVRY